MPVNDTAPQYDAHAEAWSIMRDVSAGEDRVKAAGTTYLPMLGGQSESREGLKRYEAYKTRASFYNATGRTIDGLSGMIFRKAPLVEHPGAMNDFVDDVTLGGVPFQGFAEMSVEEVLTTARAGILVDFPRVEAGGLTQAQAERMNLRPFWSLYKTENVLNWQVGQIGNRTVLTQVRLWEEGTEAGEDEFTEHPFEQIRVLDLTPGGEAGDGALIYRQRVFREREENGKKTGVWEKFGDDIIPTMQGAPLDFIPFVFLGPRDTTPQVSKPPLIDLAYVNLSHYRTVADLEHGAHFTALPTPYAFGFKDDDAPVEVGPEALWVTDNENAKAGLLEFSGQGLEALDKRREVKEQQMAALGARMLAPEKRQAEAAETAAIHRQGEMSVLASLSQAVSLGLTRALEIARDWMGVGGEVNVRLNTDFLPTRMDAQQLQALMQLWQSGGISFPTLFDNLQRGEIVDPERTAEEEQAEIETSGAETAQLRAFAQAAE